MAKTMEAKCARTVLVDACAGRQPDVYLHFRAEAAPDHEMLRCSFRAAVASNLEPPGRQCKPSQKRSVICFHQVSHLDGECIQRCGRPRPGGRVGSIGVAAGGRQRLGDQGAHRGLHMRAVCSGVRQFMMTLGSMRPGLLEQWVGFAQAVGGISAPATSCSLFAVARVNMAPAVKFMMKLSYQGLWTTLLLPNFDGSPAGL